MLAGAEGRSLNLGEQSARHLAEGARVKFLPTIESLRQVWPPASTPSAASSAVRAEVADPVGERSTSPSAKIVTFR